MILRHDYIRYKTHKDMISKTIRILSIKSIIMFYESKNPQTLTVIHRHISVEQGD